MPEIIVVHSATKPATLSILYSTRANATGGLLDERVHTTDGTLDFVLARPKELGGGPGPGTNPEQLLAAAYAASLHAALLAVCSRDGPKFPPDASVQGTVAFGLRPDGGFGLEFTLGVKLPGFERAAAEALLEKAAHICSVCDATRKEALRLLLI
jgi:Ohr subfamily peroxiredoxin